MIGTHKLSIAKQRKAERKLQFSKQYNIPRGTLERSLGALHIGSLFLIETKDSII